ncbi:MAG: hypothetical protein IPI67_10930 [Myxococcales bacterium]|nr:hypothetical protein [Myxococcales bacterium]
MVSLPRSAALVLGALALASACQAVIGLEDKQLDPKPGSGGAAGTGGAAGSSGDAGGAGPKGSDAVPPKRPPGPTTPGGGATRWFAAKTIFLGTYDPVTKKPDSTAWRRIGHNVDGECTTAEISKSNTSSTCVQPKYAPPDSLEDGDDCRDNAAGRLLAVGIQVVPFSFEPELHAGLLTGETATYLLRLDDLADGPDDPYVRGSLYVTVPRDPTLTKPPSWNGSDQFVVDVASVDTSGVGDAGTGDAGASDASASDAGAGDAASEAGLPSSLIEKPLFVFETGYLSKNVWVSGDLGESPRVVPLFAFDRLTIVDTVTTTFTLELTPQHDQAESSQLSVAIGTSELEKNFRPIALELTNCVVPLQKILMDSYVLPARDLGTGPTLKTPGTPCEAESFAFAFEWKPVKAPVTVASGLTKPAKCGDGGT